MSENYTFHDYARLFATFTNQNIFLTGKAGTGKTTFLRALQESSIKQMAVVAPTGVAAINAGGTTIHSFFQLPFTPFLPTENGRKELIGKMKMHGNRRKVLRELELLVIDEISMVRADVLDAIDAVLRSIRYRHNEPFGGVQMIFIGDMYQLSPVVQQEEWKLLSRVYKGVFFFNSLVFQEKPFVHIEFDKIFRQKDVSFIKLLNEVRNNNLSRESYDLLQQRYNPLFVPAKNDTYVILTTHNYKADRINREELDKIDETPSFYKAKVRMEFSERNFPAEENLELKVGAKVMFIKNDTENPRRFYNGKIGVVTSLKEKSVIVKCPEDEFEIEVQPMIWENIRYRADDTTLEVSQEIIGTFSQLPLRLAWAITIHKSQGLTFDKAIIDAEMAFAPGQVYVALSRCRTLDGLVLQSKITDSAIQNDHEILRFSSNHFSLEQLDDSLNLSQRQYFLTLLLSVFNFRQMLSVSSRWIINTQENLASFGEDSLEYLRNISAQINHLNEIGEKFGLQLAHIVQQNRAYEEMLNLRLEASSVYFSKKLNVLIETLKQSPVSTDSKEYATEFDRFFSDIYTFSFQKLHWITGLKSGFSIQKYFELRKTFELPTHKISAYSRSQTKKKVKSKHPELMSMLFELRNLIVDETGLPIYLVAGTKTIMEMADYLPQNKSDMLKISGIGEAKYEQYGASFLEVIRDYCDENGLSSAMQELFDRENKIRKEKGKAKKKSKGTSALETYDAFQEGKSIEQIASERNLTQGTIAGHLAEYVMKEKLEIKHFVSKEKLKLVQEVLSNSPEDVSTYSVLKDRFTDIELKFILAWIRSGNTKL